MGVFSKIANRIRQAWTKDKEQVALQLAKGATAAGYPASGYDILQAYGYEVLADYLRLEQDLLSRYADYEEMDDYPELWAAINVFADDATQPNTQLNRTVWVTSANQNVANMLNQLLHRQLRMDEEIWEIARTLCKYGSDFEELLVTADGVVGLNYLPPPTVRRIEGPRGELYGFIQDFLGRFGYTPEDFRQILAMRTALIAQEASRGYTMPGGRDEQLAALEDWEVVHFRLRGKHRRSVYGGSVLEGVRWVWKRLMLLEDSALLYRLTRAPERFAFYVDVGNLPPAEALAYVNRVRQQYKKRRYVNPTTGKMDFTFEALAQDEDIFVPSRKGQDSTRIDVLSGPQWQHMDDIEYFQGKMFSGLSIPKAYLQQDDNTARAVLSSEDVRFARAVLRIQRELRNGIGKICRVHMAALGMDPHAHEYEVRMQVPSSIYELAQLEVKNAQADLASRLREFMSLEYLYREVFGLSDEAIARVYEGRERDVRDEAVWAAKGEAAAADLRGPEESARPRGGNGAPKRSRLQSSQSRRWERELQRGGGREAERRAGDKLDRLLRNDAALRRSIGQLRGLLQELSRASGS